MGQSPLSTNTMTRLVRNERGAAAVEFALLLPVLVAILVGLIDASRLIVQSMEVKAAAQAGADYAQRRGWNAQGVADAVSGATPLAVSATPAPRQITGCVSGQSIVETTAAQCPAGGKPGRFVAVAAQAPFRPLAPWPADGPLPSVLKANAVVRVQ